MKEDADGLFISMPNADGFSRLERTRVVDSLDFTLHRTPC